MLTLESKPAEYMWGTKIEIRGAHVVARIVSARGEVLGTGRAGTEANAIHFAIKHAAESGHTNAARGHARIYGDQWDKAWAEGEGPL